MDLSSITRPGVVAPRRVGALEPRGPTLKQIRTKRFRRTSYGMYVPAKVDGTVLPQRIVEAAGALPPYGAVTGWAALAWVGGHWFDGVDGDGGLRPIQLVTGDRNIRPGFGYTVSEERLAPGEITTVDGLPVTIPERSLAFEMRYAADVRDAVRIAGMAFFDDLTDLAAMWAYTAKLNGWTGVPRLRDALRLSDENSWSPQECKMRLIWERDAGKRRPLCNQPIFDADGRLIGTPDLLDPVAGVIGEYDGELHSTSTRRSKDMTRDEAYRAVGLEVVVMVAAEAFAPAPFVSRLEAAYGRSRGVTGLWTIDQPDWWVDTTTVQRRRQVRAAGLDEWLWWQAA